MTRLFYLLCVFVVFGGITDIAVIQVAYKLEKSMILVAFMVFHLLKDIIFVGCFSALFFAARKVCE